MNRRSRWMGQGLRGRLVRVFLLQALAISVAAVLGVFAAGTVVERVLVQEALEGEAEHFWQRYDTDPLAARPDTNNLMGYLVSPSAVDALPPGLADAAVGYQRVSLPGGRTPLVHVSEHQGARLYLVFDEVQVSRLALLFGIAPLSVVLLVIYFVSWLGFRLSHGAVSPVMQLAHEVESVDVRNINLDEFRLEPPGSYADTEVQVLATALNHFIERMQAFIRRERNFTRNASHELRTPLAVLKGNVELLEQGGMADARDQQTVARMNRTIRDMEALLETLLMLAREEESSMPREAVLLNDLLAERFETCQRVFGKPAVKGEMAASVLLRVMATEKVLSIIFTNLLRNAFDYTEAGFVRISVEERTVSISDSGPGMNEEALSHVFEPFYRSAESVDGHGLGLTLVHRLCQRFGWRLAVESEPGKGTSVRVTFPEGEIVGRSPA